MSGTLDTESAIVPTNTSSSSSIIDIASRDSTTGSHNLIMNPGTTVPGDTLTGADPQHEPLARNGPSLPPLAQALAPTRPAIDRGSNPKGFNYDERSTGCARVVGISADIGAYEHDGTDTDTIFANGFG